MVKEITETLRIQTCTRDPDEMADIIAVPSRGVTIDKLRPGRFYAGIEAVRCAALSIMCLKLRNIDVTREPDNSFTGLTIPLLGGFEIDRKRHSDRYDHRFAHVQSMDRNFNFSSSESSILVVNVDESMMSLTARKLAGHDRVGSFEADKGISFASHHGARLWRSVCALWSMVGRPNGAPMSDIAVAELEQEIATSLVLDSGIAGDFADRSISAECATAPLRRVEEWVATNLDRPIARADLCDVSGLQPRALTRAFSKYRGCSPMKFVRDRRLDAVQRALIGSNSDETTVTRVALDKGFAHLGRFAVDYQAAFGEHPSKTLRS